MIANTFNQTTSQYVYDGLGRRVTKTAGGQTTTYVYDPFGNLAQEYSATPAATGTTYPVADALGSTRLLANSSGAAVRCYDYLPFGEELGAGTGGRTGSCFGNATYPASSPDVVNQKFTGKERDAETGLDFFEARYMSAAQGRFTTPDPIYFQKEMLVDPQRWNLYAYVRNNPLAFIDPHGEAIELIGDEEERKRLLEAIRAAVGTKAAPYLYQNEIKDSDGKTRFFVGIYSGGPDGKGPDIRSLGVPAAVVSDLVQTQDVIGFHLAKSNAKVEGGVIGRADLGMSPGVTNPRTLQVTILDPAAQYGISPPAIMEDLQRTPLDPGIVTIHEFGHVAYTLGLLIPGPSNRAAVDLENHLRRLRDPKGPIRLLHNLPY